MGCSNLSVFFGRYLHDNHITALPSNTFQGLAALQILWARSVAAYWLVMLSVWQMLSCYHTHGLHMLCLEHAFLLYSDLYLFSLQHNYMTGIWATIVWLRYHQTYSLGSLHLSSCKSCLCLWLKPLESPYTAAAFPPSPSTLITFCPPWWVVTFSVPLISPWIVTVSEQPSTCSDLSRNRYTNLLANSFQDLSSLENLWVLSCAYDIGPSTYILCKPILVLTVQCISLITSSHLQVPLRKFHRPSWCRCLQRTCFPSILVSPYYASVFECNYKKRKCCFKSRRQR